MHAPSEVCGRGGEEEGHAHIMGSTTTIISLLLLAGDDTCHIINGLGTKISPPRTLFVSRTCPRSILALALALILHLALALPKLGFYL